MFGASLLKSPKQTWAQSHLPSNPLCFAFGSLATESNVGGWRPISRWHVGTSPLLTRKSKPPSLQSAHHSNQTLNLAHLRDLTICRARIAATGKLSEYKNAEIRKETTSFTFSYNLQILKETTGILTRKRAGFVTPLTLYKNVRVCTKHWEIKFTGELRRALGAAPAHPSLVAASPLFVKPFIFKL